MNQLHESLDIASKQHVYDEKIILAHSLRVGHQWLDGVSMGGGTPVNVSVSTLMGLVIRMAESQRTAVGATVMNAMRGEYLTGSLFRELAVKENGYILSIAPSSGLVSTMYRMIIDLRLAGLEPDNLDIANFESEIKGCEIKIFLERWNERLREESLADYPQLLVWATEEIQSREDNSLPHLLIPENSNLTWLEEQFLAAWPKNRIILLQVDKPGDDSGQDASSDLSLLQWVNTVDAAPTPLQDDSVKIFRALGERNEVRGVLRRCLAQGKPLDTVELLYTDTTTYLPLIFETAHTIFSDDNGSINDIPVTFAQGVPARYARPARALALFTQWVKNQHPQTIFVQMLQEDLLEFPELSGQKLSNSRMATLFREIFIGFGESRYESVIDRKLNELEGRIEDFATSEDNDEEEADQKRKGLERKHATFCHIKELIQPFLALGRSIALDGTKSLDAAQEFLNSYAKGSNTFDNYARTSLIESISALHAIIESDTHEEHGSMLDWLQDIVQTTTIAGAGPRPGCLHVAPMLGGGQSGRPNTFIVGLNDNRFPGAGLQDPLLLDHERKAISDRLSTASESIKQKKNDFTELLTQLRGSLTLSYSCQDVVTDHDSYPSPSLLSIYRIISGNREGDIETFIQWLDPAETFSPQDSGVSLTPDDWWLWRLCGPETISKPEELVHAVFPNLAQGNHALSMRSSNEFTEFDGFVPEAGSLLSPTAENGRPVSASALETLAKCPFQFFMRYGLRVQAPDTIEINPTRWLEANETGTLLHDVFRDYMRGIRDESLLPDIERDKERIHTILDKYVNQWLDQCPPPTESVYRREFSDLQKAINTFLIDETERCKSSCTPMYFEAALGMPSDGSGTPLDSREPVTLTLPSGNKMRARGQIDRIDQVGEEDAHAYEIWDYKTGGTSQFKQDDPFQQGRKIQNTLYMLMADQVLKASIDPKAQLHRFGYFFPSIKGKGERISWPKLELSDGITILDKLCALASNGAFPHSHESGDCYFCDHAELSDVEIDGLKEKLDDESNRPLTPFRELRNS